MLLKFSQTAMEKHYELLVRLREFLVRYNTQTTRTLEAHIWTE